MWGRDEKFDEARQQGGDKLAPQRWREGVGKRRWGDGPGEGVDTAAACLAALPEDGPHGAEDGSADKH